jgi:hypothetical protein
MAREFQILNASMLEGDARGCGLGESVGALVSDAEFRDAVAVRCGLPVAFRHPDVSVAARCLAAGVPLTVHVGIGTDVIDQHPNFDGGAKGACSGRDFLIFTEAVCRASGGVFVNVGSAVTGPEVLLKAVSMAANAGRAPDGLTTVDLDLRPYRAGEMANEASVNYYFRDQKSVVTRVPEAFGGRGFYVQGDQRLTFPRLYQEIVRRLGV